MENNAWGCSWTYKLLLNQSHWTILGCLTKTWIPQRYGRLVLQTPRSQKSSSNLQKLCARSNHEHGLPSGGVCSTKFWIAFDEAAKILNTNGLSGELLADDGNGQIGGTDIKYMAQRINRVWRDLSNLGKCGLTFNASKTVVIFFSKTNMEKKKYDKKKLIKTDGV